LENHFKYILEIATTDLSTTRSAVEGGADRIELCSNLAEGGTTPSFGTLQQCRETFSIPLYPIIRPRGGDFLYTEEEFRIMMKDIRKCKELRCEGIVTGILNKDGTVDRQRMDQLINAAYPMGVTFHRAFDRCANPFEALELLVELGCERLLTSGQKPTAPEGVELIAELNRTAGHLITIMPGSGVRLTNIAMLAEKTGCTEFHTSLRRKVKSGMEFIHPDFESSEESYFNNAIDVEEVKELKKKLALGFTT
jgi:copper homeostasis protein